MASLGSEMPRAIQRANEVRAQMVSVRGMPNVIVEPQIAMIDLHIAAAVDALASGDLLSILSAYENVKDYRP